MRLAIFDLDGTLVSSGSERAFWRYLARHGHQGPRQVLAFAVSFARHLPAAGIHITKKEKAYLAGLNCAEIDTLAEDFVARWAPEHWLAATVQRLEQLQRRGDTIALLSGTPDFLLRPLAAELGVKYFLGSVPASRNGSYRAALPVVHPFAEAKLALAAKLLKQLGLQWADVSAYGDSIYDLPLLQQVGEAVAVNPDRRLRTVANARGWEVIEAQESKRAATT